jgi:magnesium-protoporphyrin IX monomethyl ester (oxidative) cyclase
MPLGISYLAANLRHDYDVEVLDATAEGYAHEEDDANGFFRFGLSLSEIRRRIESARPDVVGVGCLYSPVWPVVRDILEVVKSIDRGIVTVVGGNHPTFLARECLEGDHEQNLDFIVLGEGEESSRELFRCLGDGAGFETVNGLAYMDALGNPVVQPKTHQIEDLDALAFPARDLMPLATYASINIPHIVRSRTPRNSSLFTSRGCPARCTFCSSTNFWAMGKRYRRRSVQNVVDEIEECIQKYGIEEFNIEDDNFTAHVPHAKELLREIIRRKLDITWNAPNGIAMWTLDEELIDLMAESGLQELVLPFESGDQETLKELIRKPLRLQKAEEVVRMIKERGIFYSSFWIIGFPGQTRASIDETLAYIERLGLDAAYLFAAFPLPGTPMAKECFEKGYIPADYDYTENTSTRGVITTEEFTAEEITQLVRKFTSHDLKLLFRNPARFFKIYSYLLKNPRNLKELGYRMARRLGKSLVNA